MSIEDRTEATLKNLEGKAQEAIGELTGDPKTKTEGKAKQVQANMMHTKENLKDTLKRDLSS